MQEPSHPHIRQVVFSKEEIASRVEELGTRITEDYAERVAAGEGLSLVCILRGAALFMADLARAIQLPLEIDYMTVSSYGDQAVSSGEITIKKDLDGSVEGRHVILVEDIIDTGLTLRSLRHHLLAAAPRSIEIASLLQKDTDVPAAVDCAYLGFTCPDGFIVGYGLDYAERYRNLPYVGILDPKIYEAEQA